MLQQVRQTLLKGVEVFVVQLRLRHAAVVLQCADGSYDDDSARLEVRHAALDVQELLRAQVSGETRLGDHIVRALERHAGRSDGVAAVGDVRKRAAVDEGGSALKSLHQVRLERVLEQCGHSALGLEVVSGDRLAVVGVAHDYAREPRLEVGDVAREAENGHDLRRNGYLESVLTGHTLHPAAEPVNDVAQLAVVHVNGAFPRNLLGVDAERVALLDVVVQHRGEEVIRGANGVEVAGEVQIDVLHGHDLRVAAAGGAALDAEHGAERGFAERDHGVLTNLAQSVGQTHAGGSLALARRRGRDSGHKNQLAVGLFRVVTHELVVYLRLVVAVELEVFLRNSRASGYGGYLLLLTRLCDFNVGLVFHCLLQCRF